MLLNVPLLHHQKSDYHRTKRRRRSSEYSKSSRCFVASSTPMSDRIKATTLSPLTKTHDITLYDSYRDSGYLTKV